MAPANHRTAGSPSAALVDRLNEIYELSTSSTVLDRECVDGQVLSTGNTPRLDPWRGPRITGIPITAGDCHGAIYMFPVPGVGVLRIIIVDLEFRILLLSNRGNPRLA